MRRLRRTTAVGLVRCLTIIALAAPAAAAQWGGSIVRADSLLASGRVSAAESLYYAASSARPRDAAARAALGRYLASRGALRIGAVLLEEARLFGGDTTSIARSLAPIYQSLGDYRALATLPRSPLSSAEQARVRWLVGHPPVLEFPDSVARIPYTPLTDGTGLGVIALGIGERMVTAIIDPQASGVVVRGTSAKRRRGLRTFGEDSNGVVAVVPELHLGDVMLTNVPARLNTSSDAAGRRPRTDVSIGLDVLRRLAPTFDPSGDTLTLRRTGSVAQNVVGTRAPMLLDDQGLRVIVDGRWAPATAKPTAQMLSTRRWTLDAKRGIVVLE
jgi:hypothetical protein